ncbi:non-ribosomal peptide synthetase/type I polyketide synthase [Streptomyces sp. DvalAA-19]|uniref:non-ribosomal peptide synthetase/type I polyketide synthase n=1 Tax=Streptomyces sp. DvalAA-19 TaxID=1839761 RepID=UPI00081AF80B|nr:non-ribosomal peptide synthetase/type I polyketide synthase [Streptomyces sp. DvalAA-19]SCD65308.1 amino acid adenylation domain-containing protein [Streptomyces sp. DvalAA-19]
MTLLDVLLGAVREAPGQVVVHVRGDGDELTVTLRELLDDALRVAGGLREADIAPGTCVPLLADRSEDFQPMFWGALAAGLVPVPLAPDARRALPIWEHLGQPPVVVDAASASVVAELPGDVQALDLDALRRGPVLREPAVAGPDEVAFLQFSSGSTGAPKGVEVTHRAVLANLEQIRAASGLGSGDVVASWMPYFHDMGLIGTHLAPLAARAKQVKIGPLTFAKRPRVWFEVADRHRATVLSAANFALALAVRRVPEEVVGRLDLSSVRLMLVGAEPIAPAVWREFARRMRPAGLDPAAAQPVYGLAEATLAVTFPPPGEVAEPLVLDRAALGRGLAVDTVAGPGALELMDVGLPVAGCAVRIVDDGGAELGDRRVGHIMVRGPQLARGYHGLPGASAEVFSDGWLRTGDLGFLREGRLCVTGRHKDVLFLNGRTFHAPDLEAVAAATPGLPPGAPAVVGSTDPVTGGERVVVFVPWARPPREAAEVLERVAARVREALLHDDVRVLALAPRAFPRTTSGKLQRQRLRERFEAGQLGAGVVGRSSSGAEAVSPVRAGAPRSRGEAEQVVREVWARVLGRAAASIGLHEPFGSLGGTSLKAMEVLVALEDAFGLTLPPAVIRDHGTVAALAGHLLATLPVTGAGPVRAAAATGSASGTRDAASAGALAPAFASGSRQAETASAAAPAVVIGMACRFPGADTPDSFWDLLVEGRDAVTPVPEGRWGGSEDRASAGGRARWGALLDDPAAFDAGYFGIGEDEARALDPQARIFLELAHEALERAGYAGPRRRGRRVGVYAAVGESGYREVLDRASADGAPLPGALTGNLPSLIAARVSQCLDLDGPALAVDTACSSGLVALHLARRSLLEGECDLAVVGGVNLHLTSTGHRLLEDAQALSPTGRSRAFSGDADGFVPGEGGAAIVLTRLDAARAGGDRVLAVVRGTAVNNDGRSMSLMAPNPLRQREVIGRAYEAAGVDPASVTYVEAHGTGTAVGDPIELRSLAHAFPVRPDGEPRLLGSVKTNIGHLLNAAALPSLVKVVLALGHRRLPPSLHQASPAPGLAPAGFSVVTEAREWTSAGPLVAGINAFGFGGTNAHAVLEEAPRHVTDVVDAPYSDVSYGSASGGAARLLTLSARSADGLREAADRLATHLDGHPELDEGDVCLTASTSRDDGPHRLAVVAEGDLAARLATAAPLGGVVARSRPRVVFLFPGQGAQFPGRDRALYRTAPLFRDTLDEASALLGPVRGRTLVEWALDPEIDPADQALTEVAQPLLVASGIALARQLREWGVEPDAVAGHSVGEIAAACVGGVLTLRDAVRFAAERGRLMGAFTEAGAMIAVRGGEEAVAEVVVGASGAGSGGDLAVAAYNGPGLQVLSGSVSAVERAARHLDGQGIPVRRLRVSRAFHSPLMLPVAERLADAARALTVREPSVPLMSTVTAEWQPVLGPEYLRDHALRPVLFGAAVKRLAREGYDTFVEVGHGATLSGAARAAAEVVDAAEAVNAAGAADADGAVRRTAGADEGAMRGDVLVLPALPGGSDDRTGSGGGRRALLETVGRLWSRGVPLDRTALDAGHRRVPLPTYPFRRDRYWADPPVSPLLHQVRWEDSALPEASAAAVRSVLLTGPDATAVELLGRQLAAEGVPLHTGGEEPPDAVVLVAGAAPGQEEGADAVGRAQETALAAFDVALGRLDATRARRMVVLTEDVHTTGVASERPRPAHAVLGGALLALPVETPGRSAVGVDLCSLDTPAQRLAAVLAELRADGDGAPGEAVTVAWRAGRRLTRRIAPLAARVAAVSPLPSDGTFLITGGGGGIGGALARELAEKGRPTLVLAGRSPQPPAGLVEELQALGATVHYRVADVSVEGDVDALIGQLPGLDGLFHAAGVVRPGTLRNRHAEETSAALAAKTRGAVLLSAALRRHGLDPVVCVAFSSVSALLPGLAGGLGEYAGANAFLDAFAASERRAGRPWQSVNLAAFAGTGMASGLGTGMATGLGLGDGSGPGSSAVQRAGGRPVATRPALAALLAACGVDAAQVLLADLEPSRSGADPALSSRTGPVLSSPPSRAVRTEHSDGVVGGGASVPVAGAVPGSVREALRPSQPPAPVGAGEGSADASARTGTAALLRRLLGTALRLPAVEIPDDAPFLTLGLDSLAAVDLVRQLERELGAALPATLFFEYRTVRELAAHLDAPADPAPVPSPAPSPVVDGAPFPLTPVQLALHTGERLHPDIPAHGYVRQTVRGPLDTGLLGRALAALADRHSMLRIRIESGTGNGGGGAPRQYVAPAAALSDWYEVRERAGSIEELENALRNRPFDLSAEPPVRAVLAREAPDLAHLVLVIHHAAGDGYSLNVLAEELWLLYTAFARGQEDVPELPVLSTDFARYAAAAAEERSSAAGAEVLAADLRHWSERLASRGEALRLPYDGDPDALPAAPLATHLSALDAPSTAALEERAAAHGVSLFQLLLAVHVRCLGRWSGGQREIAVNVARARRDVRLPGLDRLVGPLADTLPLLCESDPDESVWELAERIGRLWLESERHATPTSLDLARLLTERPAGAGSGTVGAVGVEPRALRPVAAGPGTASAALAGPGTVSPIGAGPRTVSPAGFSFARFPATLDARCPVTVRPTAAGTGTPATRLSLLCWQDDTALRFSWNFPVHLFDPATVARLDRDFHDELTALAAADGPTAHAGAEAPRPTAGSGSGSGSATIVERLLARFRATPDAIAVDTGAGSTQVGQATGTGTTLTYAELDRASHALAARLVAQGVTPGSLVGLLTEPGADAVVSVVAVLRAGAGWVPLDAGHPTARLADQLDRSGARTVLCHAATRAAAEALGDVTLVPVDLSGPVPQESEPVPQDQECGKVPGGPDGPVDADTLAYVIFTSGSTGRPKAVPITYRSMENYLSWAIRTFGYDEHDRLAQTASLCFDASVRQLLAPLLVGATVVTVGRDLLRDPDLLLTHVERTRITVWSSVPTLWEQLLTASEERVRRGAPRPGLSALRWIHVGGEALSPAHVRRWFDLFGEGPRIANLYGPTEATINTTCHIIRSRPADDVTRLPIGRPVAGTEVAVVGPDGEDRRPGEAGELLIAGVGLTPGYLGEPALTEAAFTTRRGRRWYRSGDRVRAREDGTLDFLGRLDDQVKVRGNRVEPGEIAAVLQAHRDVTQAVVLLRDGRLVAFVTPRAGAPGVDPVALRVHLAATLPPYMVPSRIVPVDRMPLTGNGKIDRRRLLALGTGPETGAEGREEGTDEPVRAGDVPRTPPSTPTEIRLARIWSALLQADDVCREDDFFAMGGDSLLVLEVFARLEKQGGPLPRPTVIYRHRTLAALATAVDAAAAVDTAAPSDAPAPAPAVQETGGEGPTPFPLTPTQRGFLLAEAMAPGSASSWLTRLRLRGPLDTARFQTSVDTLVVRHPMLRTVFPAGARPAVQQELPPSLRLPVDFETLTGPHQVEDRVAAERERRFEPWAWPLLRLRVLTLAPDDHVLVVHAHHIIGDGYSAALLIRELTTVYDALSDGEEPALVPLRSTFRDHAVRLAGRDSGTAAVTSTPPPAASASASVRDDDRWARLSAPYDPPVLGDGEGGARRQAPFLTHSFTIEADQVEKLRHLASRAGATLYAPVLTAYYRALVAETGRADLVLGLALSGRDHTLPDAHRVFGPYATAVPLRPVRPDDGRPLSGHTDFTDDLRRVVAEATAAQVHDGPVPSLPNGLPLASQFFFTYLDFSALGPESGRTLAVRHEDSGGEGGNGYTPPPVGTDVFLAAGLDDGRLRLTVRASAAAFTPDGLAVFAGRVRDGLTRAVAAPSVPEQRRTGSRGVPRAIPGPRPVGSGQEPRMDAALIGYLPSPAHLARLARLPEADLPREQLRALLFPDGRPRLLETLSTPLGCSGFVCVPLFADELAPGDTLLGHTARGVDLAASFGARSVSLAGMIPALTGYGFDVVRAIGTGEGAPAVTTGHAATVVSVVKTVHAALEATGQELNALTVAFVGLGSIGSSSLELLLGRAPAPPARLLLCDVLGSGPRLKELAERLRERRLADAVDVLESDGGLPGAVYGARIIVAAVSGGGTLLDVDRLEPGTTVVDDSFPHCFDTGRAVGRMDRARDVLVVGGGLLSAGPVERQVAEGLPAAAVAGYLAQPSIPDTIASCRLESLLHASGTTDLPLVRGPVGTATGRAYWAAAEATGTRAAPLHLLTRTIDGDMARQVPNRVVLPGRQDHVDRVGRVDRSDLLNLGERRFGSET